MGAGVKIIPVQASSCNAASTTRRVGRYFALGNTCPVHLFLVSSVVVLLGLVESTNSYCSASLTAALTNGVVLLGLYSSRVDTVST